MTDRGVSEVLGFVMVFSLVTASVGAVYVVGFTGLQDARDAERIDNAERAMDVLADNVEDIYEDDAPNRATEIKLYDASLTVGERTKVAVNITNNASDVDTTWNNESIYPIKYVPQNSPTRLRYSNGAVFREDRNGARMLNRPPIVLRNESGVNTTVITIVQTRPGSNAGAISGQTTVLVRTEHIASEVLEARSDPESETVSGDEEYAVTYRIQTTETRAPLWRDYLNDKFEETFGTTDACELESPNSGNVHCEFTTERLYVTITRINVDIES